MNNTLNTAVAVLNNAAFDVKAHTKANVVGVIGGSMAFGLVFKEMRRASLVKSYGMQMDALRAARTA